MSAPAVCFPGRWDDVNERVVTRVPAKGGVRTPWVDVPIAKTSGVGSDEIAMSDIFGSGEQFDAATLRQLYPGGAAGDPRTRRREFPSRPVSAVCAPGLPPRDVARHRGIAPNCGPAPLRRQPGKD
jgi:hypothetical protein